MRAYKDMLYMSATEFYHSVQFSDVIPLGVMRFNDVGEQKFGS